MNRFQLQKSVRTVSGFLLGAAMLATSLPLFAQAPHLTEPQPGGMPGVPVITAIRKTGTNEVEVQWAGPSGYYLLMRKLALEDASWEPTGDLVAGQAAVVTATQEKEFFRVAGPSPSYAGSEACRACHYGIHQTESDTRHAHALETLKAIGQGGNPSCLPCHTVGYQLPTGFTTEAATPHLAGVQCENCHGPAARHADDPDDLTIRPRIEIAGQMCGGCHTDSHHPTYDEWNATGHAVVVEDMNGGRIDRCGRCHSGSARMALIDKEDPAVTVEGDANVGITCVVCHNPHANTTFGHQVRYTTTSTNDYFMTTSTDPGESFLDQFDSNINLCAQCHNHRGADWESSSRPPHHSPQYNMMLGTVGLLPDGWVKRGGHHGTLIDGQCVTCHMQTEEYESESQPAVTGHKFEVDIYDACLECHYDAESLVVLANIGVTNRINLVKNLLDEWATSSSCPPEISSYGALAWEYDHAGALSNPDGLDSIRGPLSSADLQKDEQQYIPENIKRARFNLYLVTYDGSQGVHNGRYAIDLLDAATEWVLEETDPVEALVFELNRLP